MSTPSGTACFNRNGGVLSASEMAEIARRKGKCVGCGIQLFERGYTLQFNRPITNDNVYHGTCIRCCPDNVPQIRVTEWAKRNNLHNHRGCRASATAAAGLSASITVPLSSSSAATTPNGIPIAVAKIKQRQEGTNSSSNSNNNNRFLSGIRSSLIENNNSSKRRHRQPLRGKIIYNGNPAHAWSEGALDYIPSTAFDTDTITNQQQQQNQCASDRDLMTSTRTTSNRELFSTQNNNNKAESSCSFSFGGDDDDNDASSLHKQSSSQQLQQDDTFNNHHDYSCSTWAGDVIEKMPETTSPSYSPDTVMDVVATKAKSTATAQTIDTKQHHHDNELGMTMDGQVNMANFHKGRNATRPHQQDRNNNNNNNNNQSLLAQKQRILKRGIDLPSAAAAATTTTAVDMCKKGVARPIPTNGSTPKPGTAVHTLDSTESDNDNNNDNEKMAGRATTESQTARRRRRAKERGVLLTTTTTTSPEQDDGINDDTTSSRREEEDYDVDDADEDATNSSSLSNRLRRNIMIHNNNDKKMAARTTTESQTAQRCRRRRRAKERGLLPTTTTTTSPEQDDSIYDDTSRREEEDYDDVDDADENAANSSSLSNGLRRNIMIYNNNNTQLVHSPKPTDSFAAQRRLRRKLAMDDRNGLHSRGQPQDDSHQEDQSNCDHCNDHDSDSREDEYDKVCHYLDSDDADLEEMLNMVAVLLQQDSKQPTATHHPKIPPQASSIILVQATSITSIDTRIKAFGVLRNILLQQQREEGGDPTTSSSSQMYTDRFNGAIKKVLSQAVLVACNQRNGHPNSEHFVQESCNLVWTYLTTAVSQSLPIHAIKTMLHDLIKIVGRYNRKYANDPARAQQAFDENVYEAVAGALSTATAVLRKRERYEPILLTDDELDDLVGSVYCALNSGQDTCNALRSMLLVLYNCCCQDAWHMLQSGIVVLVVDIMAERMSSPQVQEMACSVLALLAAMDDLQINLSIVETEGPEKLHTALLKYPDNPSIQREGLKCFRHLAQSGDKECRMAVVAEDGIHLAVQAIQRYLSSSSSLSHTSDERVLESACGCLQHLIATDLDPSCTAVLSNSFCESIVLALQQATGMALKESCLAIMETMVKASEMICCHDLVAAGAVPTLLSLCQDHMDGQQQFVETLLRLLYLLAKPGNESTIADANGISTIANCMLLSIEHPKVLLQGCKCIGLLAKATNVSHDLIQRAGATNAIVMAMTCYSQDTAILLEACRALEQVAAPTTSSDNAFAAGLDDSGSCRAGSTVSHEEVRAIVDVMSHFSSSYASSSSQQESRQVLEAACATLLGICRQPNNRAVVVGCGDCVTEALLQAQEQEQQNQRYNGSSSSSSSLSQELQEQNIAVLAQEALVLLHDHNNEWNQIGIY